MFLMEVLFGHIEHWVKFKIKISDNYSKIKDKWKKNFWKNNHKINNKTVFEKKNENNLIVVEDIKSFFLIKKK